MSGEELIAAAARVKAARIAVNANVADYRSITTSNDEGAWAAAREKEREYVAELQMADCDFAILQMRWWNFTHEQHQKNQQEWREHRAEAMEVNNRILAQNEALLSRMDKMVEFLGQLARRPK